MRTQDRTTLRRRISDFCRARIAFLIPPRDVERLQIYLLTLIADARQPPQIGKAFDWLAISQESGIEPELVVGNSVVLRPAFLALANEIPKRPRQSGKTLATRKRETGAISSRSRRSFLRGRYANSKR